MITPRETRLLRAPTLRAFQRAIAESLAGCAPASAPAVAVLTPTRAATDQLRRTLAAAGVDARRAALVTRGEWYEWLRGRSGSCPPLLTAAQREVVVGAATGDALAAGCAPPFRLRPGIVAALLAFYDQLRRHRRPVDAFERFLVEELEPSAGLDRGARRLLSQTRFLVAAFRAYDRRLDALDFVDEHRLRERLLAAGTARPVSEVVVTVPDQAAHAAGLYPADFDLLARLPRLARVTVVATDAVLDSGYRERLEDLLPGLSESRADAGPGPPAAVVVPDPPAGPPCFAWRDREEELRGIARQVRRSVLAGGRPPSAAAVVVQRPLPYLYLAPSVFGEAGLPVRAGDSLPLAVEPYAAAVDLVVAFAAGGFRHGPAIGLLRSPHFRFGADGPPPSAAAVRALDRALSEMRFTAGVDTLAGRAEEWRAAAGVRRTAAAALDCVLALAGELRPLRVTRPLAAQLATLRSFLERHAAEAAPGGPAGRGSEGRTLVRQGLAALEAANRSLRDAGGGVDAAGLAPVVRRWIESRTFPGRPPAEGVHLIDVHAAAYGRFDDVFVAGLVEAEWPGRTIRNVFYPGGLLAGLGWPRERDRLRASRAAFHDLLGLAAERVWLSNFHLEDDAVVTASPLLEDLDGLAVERIPAPDPERAAAPGGEPPVPRADEDTAGTDGGGHTAPGGEPPVPRAGEDPAGTDGGEHTAPGGEPPVPRADPGLRRRWRALRAGRSSRSGADGLPPPGRAGRQPERTYAVSALERYAACPFQYFASDALGLETERRAEETMTPEQRGLFLHRVFESFFRDWQAAGHGAVTLANFETALERFAAVAEDAVGALPPLDRAVARGWLLGSAAAPGLAERVFAVEIEGQTGVAERLLEYRVDGRFELGAPPARRTVALRGVIDRIDLHADRTFRVIDYKAGRPPHPSRALQLPVYARCAERQLRAERGEDWRAAEALYLAFGDPRLHVSAPGGEVGRAIAAGEERVVELVGAIEAGEYPPRPADRLRCATCPFPTVCRKEHVDDA